MNSFAASDRGGTRVRTAPDSRPRLGGWLTGQRWKFGPTQPVPEPLTFRPRKGDERAENGVKPLRIRSESRIIAASKREKMMPQTNTESLAVRLAPHLELLHDFFQSRGVIFGEADNIRAFAARLASPGSFYEDMSSMLRTIVFRENMGITRAELLDLLCIAVGGARYGQAHPAVDIEIGQMLVFVNVVLLSIRKRTGEAGAEIGESAPAPQSPEASPPTKEIPSSDVPLSAPELAFAGHTAVIPAANEHVRPSPAAVCGTNVPVLEGGQVASYPEPSKTQPLAPRVAADEREHFDSSPPVLTDTAFSTIPTAFPSPIYAPPSRRRAFLSRSATLIATALLLLLAALMFLYRHPPPHSRASPPTASTGPKPDLVSPKVVIPTLDNSPETTSATVPAENERTSSSQDGAAAGSELGKPAAGTPLSREQVSGGVQGTNASPDTGSAVPNSPEEDSTTVSGTNEDVSGHPEDLDPTKHPERDAKEQPIRAHDAFSVQHSSRKGLFSVSSGVMGANLIAAPAPEYPVLAKLTRIEGQVILQAVVSRRGTVVATHVLQGHHLLRSAAESCVRKWRYRPYLVNGRPTDVETIVFVDFHLHR